MNNHGKSKNQNAKTLEGDSMKKIIYVTRDDERAKITFDTEMDISIGDTYDAGSNTNNNRWTSYHAHKTKSGEVHYYIERHSCWQGESNSIETMTKEDFFENLPSYLLENDDVEIKKLLDDGVREL